LGASVDVPSNICVVPATFSLLDTAVVVTSDFGAFLLLDASVVPRELSTLSCAGIAIACDENNKRKMSGAVIIVFP